jgi:tetrahydromethanopterin S-methyltransferase subunit G
MNNVVTGDFRSLRNNALRAGPRPPDNGDMEARLAKLEATMEHVKSDVAELKADVRELRRDLSTDFRILFGAVIAVALGLAGLMAKGFHWI